MQIKILFDNTASDKRFLTGWGFSCLVDEKILFDTGEDSKSLLNNMKIMQVDIPDIEAVVISHDHWDHTGGLWDTLKENSKIKIYICPHFSKEFVDRVESCGGNLVKADKLTQIRENIYTTGEIEGEYSGKYMPEQSLVLRTSKGITIITGCAHPGVIKIIDTVKKQFNENIYLVIGGLHLKDNTEEQIREVISKLKMHKVEKIAPVHCTGKSACNLIRQEYKNNFVQLKIGDISKV